MERDKNVEIKKSDIHFVAGKSIELDINFNYILATEWKEGSISKFIKEAVVGYYEAKIKQREDNTFKEELDALKVKLCALEDEIKKGVVIPTPAQSEKIERIQTEIKSAEIKPLKSSRGFLDEW